MRLFNFYKNLISPQKILKVVPSRLSRILNVSIKNYSPRLLLIIFILFGITALAAYLSFRKEHNATSSTIKQYQFEARSCLRLEKKVQLSCLDAILKKTTNEHGIGAALDIIEPLSEEFTYLLEWSHPFSHSIGGHALKKYEQKEAPLESQIGRALVECDGFGAFGCYHGVIEVGLSLLPVEKRASVIR